MSGRAMRNCHPGTDRNINREKKTPDPKAANEICIEAFRRGVYLLNMGSYGGRALRVAPPLIINDEQADTAIEILDKSIEKVEKG